MNDQQRQHILDQLAGESRQEQFAGRQCETRRDEAAARRRAANLCDTLGESCREVAGRLGLTARTLSHWHWQDQHGQLDCRLRGRPCQTSSCEQRQGVLSLLEHVGPHLGLPTLRGAFPDMPRCELRDLQQAYRRCVRSGKQIVLQSVLTWRLPGSVWAVDHAEPPWPIDGDCLAILAVRDLASGMQLAWLPVPDQTGQWAASVLAALFAQHGAPLVLKSDNGAFTSAAVQQLLANGRIIWLASPPRTPSYNGSCEAGIGSMKIRTIFAAARSGDALNWTSDDLEAARRQANELHRPDGHQGPVAQQLWERRDAVDDQQRQHLREAIDRRRSEIIASKKRDGVAQSKLQERTLQRIAIRQALVELGMLTIDRRPITLPIKPKKLANIM